MTTFHDLSRRLDDLVAPAPDLDALVTLGDTITVRVNGKTVNSCHNTVPVAGKILLQSEGFELYVRKFELHPLTR